MKRKPRTLGWLMVAALVAVDLVVWSQVPLEHTPFRMLDDFECSGSNQTGRVGIVPSDYSSLDRPSPLTGRLDYEQVEQVVGLAVELAGGLEPWLEEGMRKVVIKPNIVEPAPNGNGVNTDWRVVKALALLLYRIDPELEIAVAEGAGGWARPGTPHVRPWAVSSDGYVVSGYREMIESLQDNPEYPGLKLAWVDLNFDEVVEVPVPEPRLSDCQRSFFLPRTMVEADFIIDVPVLKVHDTRITVGLKNYVGVLPGMVYGWSKDQGYNGNGIGLDHSPAVLEENFVDIVRTVGCDFVVVDCIVGKEKSKYTTGISKRRNMVVAGRDIVSVDAVCARLMDINPDDVEHICLAAYSGLGQNDLEMIEVAGAGIEQAATPFIKSGSMMDAEYRNSRYPYYGQSNRVWLLSGPFPGLEMDTDFLEGESTAAPLPGEDGWTEPVYFFDNVIDPAGYFLSSADCVYYAFSYLLAPEDAAARIWLGSRQDLKVWLNGELVYDYSGSRRHRLPNEVIDIRVSAGINRILVKAGQRYQRSEFSLNICDTENNTSYAGNRLAGIKFLPGVELTGSAAIHGGVVLRGRGIEGIAVSLESLLLSEAAVSSSSGGFFFPGLPQGKYTVRPAHADYRFYPPCSVVVISDSESIDVHFEAVLLDGDYNGDRSLDIFDLLSLLAGVSGGSSQEYDFNGDGQANVTDVADLILFLKEHQ
ncbi:MAG: DUF362 domain-containing protein [Candidatus Glassbacteria bacterium]|nr:DUF362 domain-containing protein [Candidatus Glassbacteria bacterium]